MEEMKELQENLPIQELADDIKQQLSDQKNIVEPTKINMSSQENFVMVSIVPDDGKKRVDNDIICVIDVSGSMKEQAHVKNEQGVKEVYGLNRLDVLKHAVRTTIYTLGENDRFGLVSFNNNAQIQFPLKNMTKEEQIAASNQLDQLIPKGKTNLWAGLKQGMEMLIDGLKQKDRHCSIILLTDGEPNILPPISHQVQLQTYLQQHHQLNFSLQTFAFGKNTNSVLLRELAEIGHGDYSFIPCPGFIGTIFVNTLSNLMSTLGVNAQLQISSHGSTMIKQTDLPENKAVQQLNISVGDIKFGQQRNFVFKLCNQSNNQNLNQLKILLQYYDYSQQKTIKTQINWNQSNDDKEDPMVNAHYSRHLMKEKVFEAMKVKQEKNNLNEAQQIIQHLSEQVHKIYDELHGKDAKRLEDTKEYLKKILLDIDGEIRLSFLKEDWFTQWGRHYLPSLMNAHQKQICNNFKDPGIQTYGGKVFNDLKDYAEDIFINLPPPKSNHQQPQNQQQSTTPNVNQSQQQIQQPQQQQQNMQVYYDAGGGCFHGDCYVKLYEGTYKKVKDLRKGDQLSNKTFVIALIKIKCFQNIAKLVQFDGGLLITPNHPVKINNQWKKPYQIKEPNQYTCDFVYNIVLDKDHCIIINGIECVTLGHCLQGQNVEHPYFGSDLIINDLKKSKQWSSGIVQINSQQFKRQQPDNKIVGIIDIY